MGILIYVIIGLLWGSFAVIMQRRKRGEKHIEGTFILNALVWPICMIIAAAIAWTRRLQF